MSTPSHTPPPATFDYAARSSPSPRLPLAISGSRLTRLRERNFCRAPALETVHVQDLPPPTAAPLQAVNHDAGSRIFVSREAVAARRRFLRETVQRESRYALQQFTSNTARWQAVEARAEKVLVEVDKISMELQDVMAMADAVVAKADAAAAKADAAAAKADAAIDALIARERAELDIFRSERIVRANSRLNGMRKALQNLEDLLRYEVLVRIMKGIDSSAKGLLTAGEIDVLKNAKFDWVAHLVKVEEHHLLPEVEGIARKLHDGLPARMQDLLSSCAAAARHYGKARRPLPYPLPTLQHAQNVLASIAHDVQHLTALDVAFALNFIAGNQSLFALEDNIDPQRQQVEDRIVKLEAKKAMWAAQLT
ncbi:hypothetical protein GGX14DRAFT_679120 [Mycena pura]|uniref:Uncharacterized protein n=1 Tax=Mycena pura TaxID=153505 RepID=A0AAD6XZS7_9AGAR|nr:hypothetical protein GGX14DRAFT_679120 [Mycena pura]